MEKRLLIAIVLSFLVLVLYQVIFVKKPPQPEASTQGVVETVKKSDQKPLEKESASPPADFAETQLSKEHKPLETVGAQEEEQISIETSLYQALWSNKGGVLKSWKLKKFRNEKKEELELVSSRSQEINVYPLYLLTTEDSEFNTEINNALYKSPSSNLVLKSGQKGEIRFDYANEKGVKIEKVFVFQDGKYDLDVKITVWKEGKTIEPRLVWGPGIGNPSVQEQKQRFTGTNGIAVFAANKVFRLNDRKFKPELSSFNFVDWAAFEDNYFAALFLTTPQKGLASFLKQDKENSSYFFLSTSLPQKIYIGPKEIDTLTGLGQNSKKLINFGFFGWIAEILLRIMNYVHKGIPNWGVAIIIMTLIIKVIFFPLTYSSTRSMAKMQELQPKIKALRAKYKKAKQDIAQRRQMNEEMMRLYKEHGINPAGGCLPMLIQLPFFWGFFRVLVVGIEFRQSPFVFWIKDLSARDPYYITPILMGATQFIQQKMTPTSADPTQARMMLIMPVIFTIFFMNFQSGLVLYWLTNNALQIGQQAIINSMMKKKKRESDGKRRKK
jgi:YidC/Oxa1 family membrane protein insertase